MKAKMTTNPRVSVHQCIPWVSAQFPNVSEPTSSGRWPQTKLSKYGYFPYKDLNVMQSFFDSFSTAQKTASQKKATGNSRQKLIRLYPSLHILASTVCLTKFVCRSESLRNPGLRGPGNTHEPRELELREHELELRKS